MEIYHRNQLPELLRTLNLPMIAVEAGCAEGYFSAELLEKGVDKLYMVDAWKTLPQFGDASSSQEWHDKNFSDAMERVKPYGDKVVVLRGLTTEMAKEIPDGSLGLVYLDAGHAYANVAEDIRNYAPKLVAGGILAGHDVLNPQYGIRQAVEDFCKDKYEMHIITENDEHPEYASFWLQI